MSAVNKHTFPFILGDLAKSLQGSQVRPTEKNELAHDAERNTCGNGPAEGNEDQRHTARKDAHVSGDNEISDAHQLRQRFDRHCFLVPQIHSANPIPNPSFSIRRNHAADESALGLVCWRPCYPGRDTSTSLGVKPPRNGCGSEREEPSGRLPPGSVNPDED